METRCFFLFLKKISSGPLKITSKNRINISLVKPWSFGFEWISMTFRMRHLRIPWRRITTINRQPVNALILYYGPSQLLPCISPCQKHNKQCPPMCTYLNVSENMNTQIRPKLKICYRQAKQFTSSCFLQVISYL